METLAGIAVLLDLIKGFFFKTFCRESTMPSLSA
jgi:hypothetical protein